MVDFMPGPAAACRSVVIEATPSGTLSRHLPNLLLERVEPGGDRDATRLGVVQASDDSSVRQRAVFRVSMIALRIGPSSAETCSVVSRRKLPPRACSAYSNPAVRRSSLLPRC